MMLSGSYVHLLVLSGLFMFFTAVSADVCYEPYRLLYKCSTYPPFITAPLAIQNLEENSDDNIMDNILEQQEQQMGKPGAGLFSGLSLSPGGGGQDLTAMGRGFVKTQFGASFASRATSYRNLESYRAHGSFALSSSHEFKRGWPF